MKPRWTNTDGSVKVYLTLGSGTTNGSQARIHTLLGFASFVQGTVIVYLTFIYKSKYKYLKLLIYGCLDLKPTLITLSVWVSCPATGTATHWSVRCGLTLGILSTRVIQNARV